VVNADLRAASPLDIRDADLLAEVLCETDIVYRLAGVADVDYAAKAPLETFDANASGTLSVLNRFVPGRTYNLGGPEPVTIAEPVASG
jgi:nucleoside-diphosphate-sugar epimerase